MITKHDREQFIILSLNVRCYGNIPLNQANIIGATCFSYVKKEEELQSSPKILETPLPRCKVGNQKKEGANQKKEGTPSQYFRRV